MIYKFTDFLLESKKDTSGFNRLHHVGGSTGADLYEDADGSKWIVKFGANTGQMWNEYLTNKVYAKGGVKVPDAYVGEIDQRKCMITQYLDNSMPLGYYTDDLSTLSDVCKGFVMDVITANWDVVGTNYDFDNIRVWNGDAYRVDVGGAMLYRAMGGSKRDMFGNVPTEHKSLRDKVMNYSAAKIFKSIDDKYLANELRDAIKKYVIDDKIQSRMFIKDVYDVVYDDDNEMSNDDKKFLFKRLVNRAVNLYKMFN